MNQKDPKILLGISLLVCIATLTAAILKPEYLGDYYYLEVVIFTEIMVLALWDYPARVFPLVVGIFLWAGTALPLSDMWTARRWFVLAIAALGGLAIYVRDRRQQFSIFHMVAFFAVVAAAVSGVVSAFPKIAVLKALSLFLLFVYAATGARLAALGREGRFFVGLLLGFEILTYLAAVSYFLLRKEIFGNPNSLGAIFGVAVLPVLLWGVFVSEVKSLLRRRMFALGVALLMLLSSYSRAGIAAAGISCVLLCVCLRRYRFLIRGALTALLAALVIATVLPVQSDHPTSGLAQFIYKGAERNDVLASRRSVWDMTVASIRRRPVFGSGFGTVATSYDAPTQIEGFISTAGTYREHGNSYLAIVEWVGLLGVVPFFAITLMNVRNAAKVLLWVRRTGDPFSPAVPLAAVVIAGVIHAAFEDWMFAVGYYLCVFFWSCAFILVDVLPQTAPVLVSSNAPLEFPSPASSIGIAVPGR